MYSVLRPIDAGQLLGQAGWPGQAMDSLVRHACHDASINTDPRCGRVPQPCSSCALAARLAASDDDFPVLRPTCGCPVVAADRVQVGPKHRCPRQRSSTVSVRPTPSRHRRRKAMAHQADFHAPSALYHSKPFKAQVIQECSEPGASIANIALGYSLNANLVHKWIRLLTQKTTAIQPAFIPLPQRWRGFVCKRAAAIMS